MRKNRFKNRLDKVFAPYVKKECKKRTVTFWASKCIIEPPYLGIVNGNGRQLVYLQTLNGRPDYYVMRIDSSIDLNSDNFNPEILLVPIEETFGNHDDYEQEYFGDELMVRYRDGDDDEPWMPYEECCWPKLSTDSGYSWGNIKTIL